MIENDEPLLLPPPEPKARKLLLIVAVIAIAVLAAVGLWMQDRQSVPPQTDELAPVRASIESLNQRVVAIDVRLNELSAQVDKNAAEAATTSSSASVADITQLQSNLAALQANVVVLQSDLKQTGNTAAAARAETQSALTQLLAFIQLREAAVSGRGFAAEFAAAKSAGGDAFRAPLDMLSPYAEKGAPTLAVLRDELDGLEAQAAQAVDKDNAQNWRDKIRAELEGLVSVRAIHDGSTLGVMQADLARGDLAAALDEIKSLPSGAQKILEDWRVQAEARLAVDSALRLLIDRLAAGGAALPPPSVPASQGAP